LNTQFLKELVKLPILSNANDFIHGEHPFKHAKEDYSNHLSSELTKIVKHMMKKNRTMKSQFSIKDGEIVVNPNAHSDEKQLKKLLSIKDKNKKKNYCKLLEKKQRKKYNKRTIKKMNKKKPLDLSSKLIKLN
jgi:Fe2+ transport system protein B